MKKLTALILAIVMIVTAVPVLASCSGNKNAEKLKIVTTIFPYYDMCRKITGDKAEVSMLVPAGSEIHSFEPTAQDIVSINKADIFIYNGGESDAWVEKILTTVDSKVTILNMFNYAEVISEQDIDHNATEENDEHIWTSLSNMKTMVQAVSTNIQPKDSANAEVYRNNTAQYIAELDELDSKFSDAVKASKRLSIAVADRFPLLYFVKEYGLDYIAAFPGCSTENQPSMKTVKRLTDYVKENKLPVVFHMDNTNEQLAKTVADETGAKVRTFYSCHTVTKEQFDKGETYISLMESNLKVLKEAIS